MQDATSPGLRGEARFALHKTLGIDRWIAAATHSVGAPRAYGRILSYDFVIFVPIERMPVSDAATLHLRSQSTPVVLGLFSTSVRIVEPDLAPGTYAVAYRTGQSAAGRGELIFIDPSDRSVVAALDAQPAFANGEPGGQLTARYPRPAREELRLECRIETSLAGRTWALRFDFNVEPGHELGTWRR